MTRSRQRLTPEQQRILIMQAMQSQNPAYASQSRRPKAPSFETRLRRLGFSLFVALCTVGGAFMAAGQPLNIWLLKFDSALDLTAFTYLILLLVFSIKEQTPVALLSIAGLMGLYGFGDRIPPDWYWGATGAIAGLNLLLLFTQPRNLSIRVFSLCTILVLSVRYFA